jgi:hypothetical protein
MRIHLMGLLLFAAASIPFTMAFCAEMEETCGGTAQKSCSQKSMLCDLPAGYCNGTKADGTCKVRSQACTIDWRPVCGCDGLT